MSLIAALLGMLLLTPLRCRLRPASRLPSTEKPSSSASRVSRITSTLCSSTRHRRHKTIILTTLFLRDAQWDDHWRLQPLGVERIPSIRDGTWIIDGERMTLRWTLRPRTWHDGRPVSCGDCVFRHAVARDERVSILGFLHVYTNKIAHVSCPSGADGREIVVVWRDRDAFAHIAVAGWGRGALPRHLLEGFYRASAAGFDKTPFGRDVTATIGDGVYRLVDWRRGDR